MQESLLKGTTPVPNALFDEQLPKLKSVELKLLLIIIRQTWGWKDERTGKRKQKDWISANQLRQKTGCSKRALSDATRQLISRKLIEVSGEAGRPLAKPEERKGKLRLFYRYRNACGNAGDRRIPKAKLSQADRQVLPTTKETVTKGDSQKGQTFRFTEHDLERFEVDLKQAGSIEQLLLEREAIEYKNGERVIVIHKNGKEYREKHLSEYSLPGISSKNLRTPYSLWMTLFHRTKKTDRKGHDRKTI